MTSRIALPAAFAAYLAAVILPNVLFAWLDMVDMAPGPYEMLAPAAVFGVGVALVTRDMLSEIARRALGYRAGLLSVLAAIILGTMVSAVLADPRIAVASGAAFLCSELLDLSIFEGLRRRGWTAAALASSYPAALLDSVIFLWLAFGSLAFLPGQFVGKSVAITAVVALAARTRGLWLPRTERPVVA